MESSDICGKSRVQNYIVCAGHTADSTKFPASCVVYTKMNDKGIQTYFENILNTEKDVNPGVAAMRTIMEYLRQDKSNTMQEILAGFKNFVNVLRNLEYTATTIVSGSEMFLRFITFTSLDYSSMNHCKQIMLDRGNIFLQRIDIAGMNIADLTTPFIENANKILTLSRSPLVLQALKTAWKTTSTSRRTPFKGKFHVYVANSALDNEGERMGKELEAEGIPCTVIHESAVAYIMEKVTCVIVEAEGVAKNGGIVNKLGTYAVGVLAKAHNKPVYVLAECYKLTRLFALNNADIPDDCKYVTSVRKGDASKAHPAVDFTPPNYISVIITDLGVLSPTALIDEVLELYV